MGKALMGSFAAPETIALLDEVRVLRQRVAELEEALAAAEQVEQERDPVVAIDATERVSA